MVQALRTFRSQISEGRPPIWLAIVALLVVGQTIVELAMNFSWIRSAMALIGLIVVILLLRGSRVAWLFILLGFGIALGEEIASGGNPSDLIISASVLICLITPSSLRYVWRERLHLQRQRIPTRIKEIYDRPTAIGFRVLAYMANWERGLDGGNSPERRSYKVLLWRLGFSCFTLLLLFAITSGWQKDADSIVVDVIARTTRVAVVVAFIAFVVVGVVAVGRNILPPNGTHQSSKSKPR